MPPPVLSIIDFLGLEGWGASIKASTTHMILAFLCLSLLFLHSHAVFQNQAEQDTTPLEAILAGEGSYRAGACLL